MSTLVQMPVSMSDVHDREISPERQARLDAIGGTNDPIMSFVDHDMATGKPVYSIDDGNNRAASAKKNGKTSIPAFIHGDQKDIEALRKALFDKSTLFSVGGEDPDDHGGTIGDNIGDVIKSRLNAIFSVKKK